MLGELRIDLLDASTLRDALRIPTGNTDRAQQICSRPKPFGTHHGRRRFGWEKLEETSVEPAT